LIHECIKGISEASNVAKFGDKCKIISLLLNLSPSLIDCRDKNGRLILSVATNTCFKNVGELMQLLNQLLQHNANVNLKNRDESSPLHSTAMYKTSKSNCVDVIRLFIRKHANLNAVDKRGQLFLHKAAVNCHPDIFYELALFLQADGKAPLFLEVDAMHRTVLHFLVNRKEISQVTLGALKSVGADFNAVDIHGKSVLFEAIRSGQNESCINWLVELGADWKFVDKYKNNALHVAAIAENSDATLLLVSLGCNVNARNVDGDTPLHKSFQRVRCCTDDDNVVATALINHGADVNVLNKKKKLPIQQSQGCCNIL